MKKEQKGKIMGCLLLCLFPMSVLAQIEATIDTTDYYPKMIVVDTVYNDSTFTVYGDFRRGFKFYFINLNPKESSLVIMNPKILDYMEAKDYKYFWKKFGMFHPEYHIEHPRHHHSTGNEISYNGLELEKAYFVHQPIYYLRCLFLGRYYNKLNLWMDGPGRYPFKDLDAYYIVMVPRWN